MTDPRTRAYRIVGKVQRGIPAFIVQQLVAAIARDIEDAVKESHDPECYADEHRRALGRALEDCRTVLLNEEMDTDAVLLMCKQRLTAHFRGIGK